MFINFAQPISLPPYWLNHPQVVQSYELMQEEAEDAPVAEMLGVPHACPLRVRGEQETEWWQLPIEPVITINGKNIMGLMMLAASMGSTVEIKTFGIDEEAAMNALCNLIEEKFGEGE